MRRRSYTVEDLDANKAALIVSCQSLTLVCRKKSDHKSADPPGLVNLGQTCYLNSSLQVLRNMAPLQTALLELVDPWLRADGSLPSAGGSAEGRLTSSLKQLYAGMSHTTEPVAPFLLLSSLRSLAPQFAEQDRSGGFAQQGEWN